MSIAAIIQAFQTRHAAISGVTSAPIQYPTGINTTDLPLILTDAGRGRTEWESHGGDYTREVRVYRVRCFCLPGGLGEGIDQGKQQAITILDALLANYRSNPVLTTTAAILIEARGMHAHGVEDTGVVGTMKYTDPETQYYGFELSVSVEERWE